MKKYESLYRRIKSEIESGILSGGERLLSIREEALSSDVSINTVLNAYEHLSDDGLITSRDRGGYYVSSSLLAITAKDSREIVPMTECYRASARETGERLDQLYERLLHVDSSFASAAPGRDILPIAELNSAASGLGNSWADYNNTEGDYNLRRRIALVNNEICGITVPENIIVTNGATEAMAIVIQTLLSRGDTVALESPGYFNFFRQLSAHGISIVEIPVTKDGIDLNILEKELKKQKIKMIITQPNVQNPTGISMSDPGKERLITLAEKYGVYLVQDDVFGDLSFAKFRPRNLCSYSDYPGIILISSFSKSIAPGLRVGWIRSEKYARQFAEQKLRISMDTSRLSQSILTAYIGTKAHRRHLAGIRKNLKARIDDHLKLLSEFLPEGSYIRRPDGGCLLWIVFPKEIDAVKMFESAALKGLITAPGAIFSASSFFNNCLRLNTGFKLTSERILSLSIMKDYKNFML